MKAYSLSRKWVIGLGLLGSLLYASPGTNVSASPIVVVKSADLAPYEQVTKALIENARFKVDVIALAKNKANVDEVISQIWESQPEVIIALGARALETVTDHFQDSEIIFGLVANPQPYVSGRQHVPGIALIPSPNQMLEAVTTLLPDATAVAVVFDHALPTSPGPFTWERRYGDIDVRLVNLAHTPLATEKLRELAGRVDAIILQPEGRLLNADFLRSFLSEATELRLPIVAYSSAVVEMGALLALEANLQSVGKRLAQMAHYVIETGSVNDFGIIPPPHVIVTLNTATAETLEIEITPEIASSVIKLP